MSVLPSFAKPTTATQARTVVQNLFLVDSKPLKATFGQTVKGVSTYYGPNTKPLYYIVKLSPTGFVVVSADDTIEPIIALVQRGDYNPSTSNTLGALVSRDMKVRMAIATSISDTHARSLSLKFAGQAENAQKRWAFLLATPAQRSMNRSVYASALGSLSDVRVAPLVQTEWSQATTDDYPNSPLCYNYYTPNNYVCGCVATAMAQLMYFHKYPTTGVDATQPFSITVDNTTRGELLLGGDGNGGPYNWNLMPLVPSATPTLIPEAQRQAIGALCHDAGTAAHMDYESDGSGAYMGDASSALKSVFHYTNAVLGSAYPNNIDVPNMIDSNLDAGYPVLLGISGDGGHAIVCDGYGYESSTLYHHLNMGWSGYDNAWYNLPDIQTTSYNFNVVDECIYNTFPQGSGEIISGRVVNRAGNPVAGATVTAATSNGQTVESVTTNANGIYALVQLADSTAYTISAAKTGMQSGPPRLVQTGLSQDNSYACGNMWGIDFSLYSPNDLMITTNSLPDGEVGSSYNVTLQADGGTAPYT
ncbi:MAG TPA: C10 family peptidase [Armatimonadota bacterium]|nr:C10 family peptidase [Armatimonadota bacterium]